MTTLWFCLVAAMLAVYVVLDGFDLGAGVVHLWAARTEDERRQVLQSIGPVWDGNEVWLIAAGGVLYFAFPRLYASSFSGFYLPLMIVLWLLMLRGISIEFRGHIDSPIWKPFWDVVFSLASALLSVFFGAALGNVIRGVPLDASGYFFLPLWTDFQVSRDGGVLDWYTVLVGLLALLALTRHGALWVAMKTEGALRVRSLHMAGTAWWGVAVLTATVTFVTVRLQPQVWSNLQSHPWGFAFPALAVGGLIARGKHRFLGSCTYLAGMMISAAFALYPYVLPSNAQPELGLTIHNSAAGAYGLKVGLAWWIPGMILVAGYFVFLYRRFAGKVRLENHGY